MREAGRDADAALGARTREPRIGRARRASVARDTTCAVRPRASAARHANGTGGTAGSGRSGRLCLPASGTVLTYVEEAG
jgi:hypothetical protein